MDWARPRAAGFIVWVGGVQASKSVWGLRQSGLQASASLPPRSSSPSATFRKSWTSASSRPRALAQLGSIAWSPSPGQTTRSWWVLGAPPLPTYPRAGTTAGANAALARPRAGGRVPGAASLLVLRGARGRLLPADHGLPALLLQGGGTAAAAGGAGSAVPRPHHVRTGLPYPPSAACSTRVQTLVTPLLGASMSSPSRSPGQGVKCWIATGV